MHVDDGASSGVAAEPLRVLYVDPSHPTWPSGPTCQLHDTRPGTAWFGANNIPS